MEHRDVSTYSKSAKLDAYRSISAHGAVAGADPHALVQMLMDAAMERMTSARACIERGEIARKAKLLHSAVVLVAELRGSLDLKKGGELAQNLSDLYDYMARRLIQANLSSDARAIAEVLGLLGEVRGAWVAIAPEVKQGAQVAASAA